MTDVSENGIKEEIPSEFKNLMNEDQIIIDSISKSKEFIIDQSISFFCFPNRDGSIRWIYPTTLKTPTFLNFYSSLSFKSKAFIVFCSREYFKLFIDKSSEIKIFLKLI